MQRHMQQAYRAILRCYPAEHRAIFGQEILRTFEQAASENRRRGTAALCFALAELTGLVTGLCKEWIAKWTGGDQYMRACHVPEENCDLPSEVVEMQKHLQLLLRRMEFAIAHHDFPKARLYCEEERAAREHLERLLNRREGPQPLHPC